MPPADRFGCRPRPAAAQAVDPAARRRRAARPGRRPGPTGGPPTDRPRTRSRRPGRSMPGPLAAPPRRQAAAETGRAARQGIAPASAPPDRRRCGCMPAPAFRYPGTQRRGRTVPRRRPLRRPCGPVRPAHGRRLPPGGARRRCRAPAPRRRRAPRRPDPRGQAARPCGARRPPLRGRAAVRPRTRAASAPPYPGKRGMSETRFRSGRAAPACAACGRSPCPDGSVRACGSRRCRTRPANSRPRDRSARGRRPATGTDTATAPPP